MSIKHAIMIAALLVNSACSSSTEMVPLLSAAGVPLTDPTEVPLRVVTRSTAVHDPLHVRGTGVVYGDVETNLGLQRAKTFTGALRHAVGPGALVTGQPAIQHDLDPQLASDLRRGEALALPLALLVLALVLGLSLALAIPFVFAACTIA
ncbi:MAG TPA: MMPL family transporter, partial [Polyangiaceae bacterium]